MKLLQVILICAGLLVQSPGAEDRRVNINTAGVEELEALPSIGPVLASRIVEHRRRHGPFKRPQEVVAVRGMSAARYRLIAQLIKT